MKTRRICLPFTGAACALLLAGCSKTAPSGGEAPADGPITGKPSDPPVELKPRWLPGHRYVLHVDMQQSVEMGLGRPRATPMETTLSQDYNLIVTNGPNGQRGLEMEIASLAVETASGDQTWLRFDSLNKVTPNEGPGVEVLEKLVGGRIRFLLGADNKVLKVEGVKELFDRATAAVANDRRGAGGGRLGWMLERIYTPDMFRMVVDLTALPNRAVQMGERWAVTHEVDGGLAGGLGITTTNLLRGWQRHEGRQCARIEFTGTITSRPARGNLLTWLTNVKIENGHIAGTAWYDPALGLPVQTTWDESYTVTGNRPAMGGRRSGTNAPATTNAPVEKFSTPVRKKTSIMLLEAAPVVPAAPSPSTNAPSTAWRADPLRRPT